MNVLIDYRSKLPINESNEPIQKPEEFGLRNPKNENKNNTPLYNFNIYLSGLFNTVPVNGKETSVNFIAVTDIFNEGKLKKYGYIDKDGNIDESKLLEILCYTYNEKNKKIDFATKLNPLYVLTMDNTSLFYTGKVNYVYPQINKGD